MTSLDQPVNVVDVEEEEKEEHLMVMPHHVQKNGLEDVIISLCMS